MSDKDLPTIQDVNKGDAAVVLPLLEDFKVVDKDNEVFGLALVEDLGSSFVATSHCEGYVLELKKREEFVERIKVKERREGEEEEKG